MAGARSFHASRRGGGGRRKKGAAEGGEGGNEAAQVRLFYIIYHTMMMLTVADHTGPISHVPYPSLPLRHHECRWRRCWGRT